MRHEPWSPDEFARLLALPDGHPERERAKASPAFEAWCRMHEEFSTATPGEAAADLAEAEQELARRLEGSGRTRPTITPMPARRAPRAWWAEPMARAAALLLVTAIGVATWRGLQESSVSRVRGDQGRPGELVLAPPRSSAPGVVLEWSAHAEASNYRLAFYDRALAEVARIEVPEGTRYVLRPGFDVPGLAHGEIVNVAVLAMRDSAVLETSRMRELRLP